MKITLYRAFPDPYRQSMTLYADQLLDSLRAQLKGGETVRDFLPKETRTRPEWIRYLSQYLHYQMAAPKVAGDINHIIDHSYAHLAHALPAHSTVITFHDGIWLSTQTDFARQMLRKYNLSALKKAAAILCDSEASRSALGNALSYPEEKTFVIPPGIDPIFFTTSVQKEEAFKILGIKPGLYLLHVGHTGTYKNIPGVFQVLSLLRKQGLDLTLLKTGTAFSAEQLKMAEDLKITDHIHHLGLVERERMPFVYHASQALLFPSFNEGFGFPVAEAMACGVPVVASRRGSLPEVAADQNFLSDPEDYSRMTRLLTDIFKNPSLHARLIQDGKRKAQNFNWEKTAGKVLGVYRNVFQSRKSK